MKKIMISILFMLMFTSGISFAQYHYRYDVDEKGTVSEGEAVPEGKKSDTQPGNYPYSLPQRYSYPQPPSGYKYPKFGYKDYVVYSAHYPFFLEVNANQTDVEAIFGHTWEEGDYNFLTTLAIGGIYSDDNYNIFNTYFTLGNRQLLDRFKFELGFKGLWGTIEKKERYKTKDIDFGAVGFLLMGTYDFPEFDVFYGLPFDLEISGSFCMAPNPVSFKDLDRYQEIKTSVGLYVLEHKKGLIFTGYRSIKARFDESLDNWEKTDDGVFLGFKFIF